MRNRPLVSCAFAIALSAGTSSAAEFEFAREDACQSAHDPYGPDRIEVTTTATHTKVVGWVGVNCSIMLSKPTLSIDDDRVVVGVSAIFGDPEAPVAACHCTEKFTMTFAGEVSDRTPVVLMVNGAQSSVSEAR